MPCPDCERVTAERDEANAHRMRVQLDAGELRGRLTVAQASARAWQEKAAEQEELLHAKGMSCTPDQDFIRLKRERDAALDTSRKHVEELERIRHERDALAALIDERDGVHFQVLKERNAALARVAELEALEDPRQAAYQAALAELATARACHASEHREHIAALAELERWRHGQPVEGDFVCPDSLALTDAQAEVKALRRLVREIQSLAHNLPRTGTADRINTVCEHALAAHPENERNEANMRPHTWADAQAAAEQAKAELGEYADSLELISRMQELLEKKR